MARRKLAAVDVPQDQAAAQLVIDEYVSADREMLELELIYERQIDALKAELGAKLAELRPAQAERFRQLKAWWEAGGRELAGRARSTMMMGPKIGIRRGMPKVQFAKGKSAKTLLEALKGLRWSKAHLFTRTKVSFDKEAVIKHIGEEDVASFMEKNGVSVLQEDEFFIDTGLDVDKLREETATSE